MEAAIGLREQESLQLAFERQHSCGKSYMIRQFVPESHWMHLSPELPLIMGAVRTSQNLQIIRPGSDDLKVLEGLSAVSRSHLYLGARTLTMSFTLKLILYFIGRQWGDPSTGLHACWVVLAEGFGSSSLLMLKPDSLVTQTVEWLLINLLKHFNKKRDVGDRCVVVYHRWAWVVLKNIKEQYSAHRTCSHSQSVKCFFCEKSLQQNDSNRSETWFVSGLLEVWKSTEMTAH